MLRRILEKLGLSVEVKTIDSKGKALLGQILVMRGKCTREQVSDVLEMQRVEGAGRRIGNLLMYNYEVSQDDIIEALDIQEYLREDLCADKSMERLEIATSNFLLQKHIFQESLRDVQITLDRTNGVI
jgi:hypothetical protein